METLVIKGIYIYIYMGRILPKTLTHLTLHVPTVICDSLLRLFDTREVGCCTVRGR